MMTNYLSRPTGAGEPSLLLPDLVCLPKLENQRNPITEGREKKNGLCLVAEGRVAERYARLLHETYFLTSLMKVMIFQCIQPLFKGHSLFLP